MPLKSNLPRFFLGAAFLAAGLLSASTASRASAQDAATDSASMRSRTETQAQRGGARGQIRITTTTVQMQSRATTTTTGRRGGRGRTPVGNPLPYHPTLSYINPGFPDKVAAANYLCDQIEPRNSKDVPHFDFWSRDHLGVAEWMEYKFDAPKKVSGVSVYWFDDRPTGGCRVPASWKLFYKDGDAWKPAEVTGAYGCEQDQFNLIGMKAVTTTGLRVELQCQQGYSAGVLEWRVE